MAWIEVHQALRGHKKTLSVRRELKLETEAQVIGHMVCLWMWALDNEPGGDLSGLENWFNAKEIYHMCDVARLFQMLRAGIAVTLSGAGLLIGLSRGRKFAKASAVGFALWAGLLAALALVIALDFSAAFTVFHEILFTNDLWLLDPRTDLLIRMCPEEMFSAMALRIGLIGLGGAAAVPLTASIAAYGRKKLDLRRVRESAR